MTMPVTVYPVRRRLYCAALHLPRRDDCATVTSHIIPPISPTKKQDPTAVEGVAVVIVVVVVVVEVVVVVVIVVVVVVVVVVVGVVVVVVVVVVVAVVVVLLLQEFRRLRLKRTRSKPHQGRLSYMNLKSI